MKIKHKLLAAYFLVALASVAVGYLGGLTTPQVKQEFDRLAKETIPLIEAIEDIQFGGLRLVGSASEFGFIVAEKAAIADASAKIRNRKEEEEEEEEEEVKEGIAQLEEAIKKYETVAKRYFPGDRQFIVEIKVASAALKTGALKIINMKKLGISGVHILEVKEAFEDTEKHFLQLVQDRLHSENQMLAQRSRQIDNAIIHGNNILLLASALAIMFAIVIGLMVFRAISIPIDKLKKAAEKIGEGQLNTQIDISTNDEIGELGMSFNTMANDLKSSQAALAQTQSQLLQSAKLASIGEMATGIAHELNQPLGIIAMNSEMQLDEISEGNFEDIKETFGLIQSQVERATIIIDHLRTFGRESNTLTYQPNDLNRLIENAFIMLSEQLRLKDIKVIKALSQELRPINCNHIQIEQVITNLIVNARDALKKTENKQLWIRTQQLDNLVILEIEDSGSGIAKDNIDKIFDPFFTTKDVGEGTGLGLSISYGIIKEHGAKLEVASIEGKGSTFRIEFVTSNEAEK